MKDLDAKAKVDARRQSKAEILTRRLQVQEWHSDGLPVMKIVKKSGLHWATVNKIISKTTSGDESALQMADRGRKAGTGRALSALQESEAKRCISRRRPWFYGFEDKLWTRDTVGQLIEKRFGTTLSVRAVSNYLARWGIQRDAKDGQLTLSAEDYSLIRTEAESWNAEVFWLFKPIRLDAAFGSDILSTAATVTLPARAPPKLARHRLIYAVNAQGTMRWKIIRGAFNAARQVKFVEGLRSDARRKLVLIRRHKGIYTSSDFLYWMRVEGSQFAKVYP